LDALLPGKAPETPQPHPEPARDPETPGVRVLELDPKALRPNPRQPRREFREEALEELAESLRRDGVQEPVIVRERDGEYELVSGERRVRAAVMADLDAVPAIVRDVSDDDMLRLGLIENIQREDLNVIEEAEAYRQLMEEFGWTQEQMASQVGKKRATVANILRLLQLPEDVRARVSDGTLSMGHARALLALESAEAQSAACRKAVEQGLSVRQVEQLARPAPGGGSTRTTPKRDPHVAAVEDRLRQRLGTKVHLRAGENNRGRIEIEYYTLDDLERILDMIQGAE
jgi:ParB family chromosome partitioning protein